MDDYPAESTIEFSIAFGSIDELTQSAISGCYNITVPARQYEVVAVLSDRPECGYPNLCWSPSAVIKVPHGGVVEIDFYPVPLNQD